MPQYQYTAAQRDERNRLFAQGLKKCTTCEEIKPVTEFRKKATGYQGLHSYCKPCYSRYYGYTPRPADWKPGHPRDRGLRHKYGIVHADVERMLDEQNGVCAICGSADPGGQGVWSVDHDHSCCPAHSSCGACIRGLLCHRCNIGLGMFGDDPETMAAAIGYVARETDPAAG